MAIESFDASRESGAAPAAAGASRRSTAIFEALQREIVLGILPPHAAVLEMDLAQRFGCSQSTVREALLQLQHEGLVERMPHRGTTVADSRGDDARELIHMRHEIECRGVRRVMKRYGPLVRKALLDEIAAMRQAAAEGDEYLLSLHDRSFHLRLYDAAELPSVRPILRRCLVHNHRYKILNSEPNRGLMETADRHMAIVEALNSGDAETAVQALSHHITTIVDFGPSIMGREQSAETRA